MIGTGPFFLMRNQQLETKTQEENPHDQCFTKITMFTVVSKQVRDSGVPESYQPIVMPSSLDTQHHYRECPPAAERSMHVQMFCFQIE